MRQFPEDYTVQLGVDGGNEIGILVKVGPARQAAFKALHHVNRVRVIITRQFLDQPGGEVSEFIPGYGGDLVRALVVVQPEPCREGLLPFLNDGKSHPARGGGPRSPLE